MLKAVDKKEGHVMETVARPDVTRYTYRVTWSAEDGEFVATDAERPVDRGAQGGRRLALRRPLRDHEAPSNRVTAPLLGCRPSSGHVRQGVRTRRTVGHA